MKRISTADAAMVLLSIVGVIGTFGSLELERISYRQFWIQFFLVAGIGYFFGIFGWRVVKELADRLVQGLPRPVQRLCASSLRALGRMSKEAGQRKAARACAKRGTRRAG